MLTWALIAIITTDGKPELLGTYKTEAECRQKAEISRMLQGEGDRQVECFQLVEK